MVGAVAFVYIRSGRWRMGMSSASDRSKEVSFGRAPCGHGRDTVPLAGWKTGGAVGLMVCMSVCVFVE